ncbi:MAG: SDR family NAD(P)-dependent oxidoreductase [Rhodobacteraceae bacterium]|nr:SDR family NAD(P)-dependent oxidoreductase [Paracoccaceae bacterium]
MTLKILITGTSGAFGSLGILTLLRAGHNVAASMRDINGRNKSSATALREKGAHVVEIDVTDDASVAAGTAAAIDVLGGLDVLVNNAGSGAHGIAEAFDPAQLLHLYDVNVVGVHRLTRAVLPTFRAQSSGLVLNVSSLLGRLSIPFYGPYSATKFALETLTETYRAELSGFGIDFALIEPGGFPTTFIDNTTLPADTERLSQLGAFADVPPKSLANFHAALDANPAQDPQKVADAIKAVIETPAGQRNFRTIVDFMGTADPVGVLNTTLDQVHDAVYSTFGIAEMRHVRTG